MSLNQFRLKSIDLLIDILENDTQASELGQEIIDELSQKIESSCNNANIDLAKQRHIPIYWDNQTFYEQYSSIVFRVLMNIDPNSSINKYKSPEIGRYCISQIIKCGNALIWKTDPPFDLNRIGYLMEDELNPHINQPYKDQIKIRSEQIITYKTTKMYQCPQCKKNDAKERRNQTRSSDEGYTIFLTCQICDYRWRIYS